MSTDPYRTLTVTPDASSAEIKRAYRILAKRYHPDRVPAGRRAWAREQMAKLNAAYEILSDPQQREQYDQQLHAPAAPTPTQGKAIWRAQRSRERSRREQIEQWRILTQVSAAALILGVILTIFFVKTPSGYLIAAGINGAVLLALLISLAMSSK